VSFVLCGVFEREMFRSKREKVPEWFGGGALEVGLGSTGSRSRHLCLPLTISLTGGLGQALGDGSWKHNKTRVTSIQVLLACCKL
jgi:hypothetical protein